MTGDNDTYRQAGRPTKAQSLALARALIHQTRASLCPHGVRPELCADHDPRRQAKPEETA